MHETMANCNSKTKSKTKAKSNTNVVKIIQEKATKLEYKLRKLTRKTTDSIEKLQYQLKVSQRRNELKQELIDTLERQNEILHQQLKSQAETFEVVKQFYNSE